MVCNREWRGPEHTSERLPRFRESNFWGNFLFSSFFVHGGISTSDWRLLKESPRGPFLQQITPFTPNIWRYRRKNIRKHHKKGGIPKNKLHHWLHTLGKFRKDPIQKTRKHQSPLENMKGPPYKTNQTIYSKHHKAKTHQKILKQEYRKAPENIRKCWRSLSENKILFRSSLFWNVLKKTSCRISF